MNSNSKEVSVEENILPQRGQWMVVVTTPARRVGYLDQEGVWRDVAHNEVIEDV